MVTARRCRTLAATLILSATVAASTACASPRGRVFIRVGPPAPIVETRVVAPGPGYVWLAGFHSWNGAALRLGAWALGATDPPSRGMGAGTLGP